MSSTCAAYRVTHDEPTQTDELDAFLDSLDPPQNDPVTVVQGTDLDHAPQQSTPARQEPSSMSAGQLMHAENDAILTEETVRDHEDQLHHDERHRMQCDKVMQERGGIGEERARTNEASSLSVAEDRDIFADPNDESTQYAGHGGSARQPNDPQNTHPLHYHECLKTKVHSVRKIAMLDELDMAPFFQKLGVFDIEGVAHAAMGDDKHFVEVQMFDPKRARISLGGGRISSSKNGWGLDTVKPDGIPNQDAPHPLQTWVITSKTWDEEVRPRLDALSKEMTMKDKGMMTPEAGITAAGDVSCDDFATLTDPKQVNFKAEMSCLLKAIEAQEKYVPFNHKLEKVQLVFRTCELGSGGMFRSGGVTCNEAGTLYIHDDKMLKDSADTMILDWIEPSTSPSATNMGAYQPPGLKVAQDSMHLEGSIDWAVTVSKKGHCTEASGPLLYIGVGVDEHPDDPHDDVDIDLGALFFSWTVGGGSGRSQMSEVGSLYFGSSSQKPSQLYETSPGTFANRACTVEGGRNSHTPSSARTSSCTSANTAQPALAEYSGDNMDGSGEGDDEWITLDLEKLRKAGITHVGIVLNIYNSGGDVNTFEKLEGAFLRVVMSGRGEKEWATATTAQYVDLDVMPSARGQTAALVAVLYVDEISHILAPQVSKEAAFDGPVNKLNEDMTKLMHLWKNAGAIDAEKKARVEAKLRELRSDREHVAKTRFEVAVAKEGIPCSRSACELTKSRAGVKDFFLRDLTATPVSDHDGKIADVKDKAEDTNAVVNNDVEASTVPGSGEDELDAFLATLDADIQPNSDLDSTGTGSVSQAETLAQEGESGMTEQDTLEKLLIDFPGGPPGADTLCLKETAQKV